MLKKFLEHFVTDLAVKKKYRIRTAVIDNKNLIINYYKKGFSLNILHQYLIDNKKLKKCSFKEFVDAVFAEIPTIKALKYDVQQAKQEIPKIIINPSQEEENNKKENESEFFFSLKPKK